jgi:hypothetical protein
MTTCGKCGAENAAGDAFCGSCGAFLEFAAEEAAEVAGAGVPAGEAAGDDAAGPAETPAGGAGAEAITVAGATTAAARPTQSTDTADSGPAAAPAEGPTCAVCGRGNPAGRTFCISCGERLGAGVAAATASRAAGGGSSAASTGSAGSGTGVAPTEPGGGPPAQPRGPAKPAWEFPTAPPRPVPTRAAPGAPEATGGSGGGSRLPLVAGLVALLVIGGGAAFVLAGGLGGGSELPPAATPTTTAPGATTPGDPGATAEPGVTLAPSTDAPTAAPASIPPGSSVGLPVATSAASSRLAGNRAAKNLHDGSPASAWIGKARDREGAWIEVTFAPAAVTRIQIWGGWQRDEPRFYGNHRPHNVTVSFDGGAPIPLALQDALGAQRVDIPPELGIVAATRVRITIVDTYPSRRTAAAGSPSKSVAISEIRLFGVPVTP